MTGFWKNETGAVAVYVALTAPILIGFAALAVEAGSWILVKRDLQQVADTVAYSAAIRKLSVDKNSFNFDSFAQRRADEMSVVYDGLKIDPDYLFNGKNRVRVELERTLPRQLTKLFAESGDNAVTISVSAVAGVDEDTGDPACISVLSGTASGAFTLGGNAKLQMPGCALGANSQAQDSVTMKGASNEYVGDCIYTAGGVRENGGRFSRDDCPDSILREYQRPSLDPLGDLYLPKSSDFSGMPSGPSTINNGPLETDRQVTWNGVSVKARRFEGLTLRGAVSIEPGVYVIDGGELNINSGAEIVGTGVSFYLTNGARLSINGNAQLTELSAFDQSRKDPYNGLLFFSDRDGAAVTHTFNGSSNSSVNGVIYFSVDTLKFSGGDNASDEFEACLRFVVNELEVMGNAKVVINTDCALPSTLPKINIFQQVRLFD